MMHLLALDSNSNPCFFNKKISLGSKHKWTKKYGFKFDFSKNKSQF